MITNERVVGFDFSGANLFDLNTKEGFRNYLIYLISEQASDSLDQRQNIIINMAGKEVHVDLTHPIDVDAIVEEFTTKTTLDGLNHVQGIKNRVKENENYVAPLFDRTMSLRNQEVIDYAKYVLKDNDFIPPYEPFHYLRKHQPQIFKQISGLKDPDTQHDRALALIELNKLNSHYSAFNQIQKKKTNKLLYDLNIEIHNRFQAANNYEAKRSNKTYKDYDSARNVFGVCHYDKRGKIDSHFLFPVFDVKAQMMLRRFTNIETIIDAARRAAEQMEEYHPYLKRGEALGMALTKKNERMQDAKHKIFTEQFSDTERTIYEYSCRKNYDHKTYKENVSVSDENELIIKLADKVDYTDYSAEQKQFIRALSTGADLTDSKVNRNELIEKLINTGSDQHFSNMYFEKLYSALWSRKHHQLIFNELESFGIRLEEHSEKRQNLSHNKKGAKHGKVYFHTVNIEGVGMFDSRVLPKHIQNALSRYSEIKKLERQLNRDGEYRHRTSQSVHDYFTHMKAFIKHHKGLSLPEIQQKLKDQIGTMYMPVLGKDGRYQSANITFSSKQVLADAKASHVATKEEIEELHKQIVSEYLVAQKKQWDEEDLQAEILRQLQLAEYNAKTWRNNIVSIYWKRISKEEMNNSNLLFIYTNEFMKSKFYFDGDHYWKGKYKKISIIENTENSLKISVNDNRFDSLLMAKELLFNRSIEQWQTEKCKSIISSTNKNNLAYFWAEAQLDPKICKIVRFENQDGTDYIPTDEAKQKLAEGIEKANAKARQAYAKIEKQLKDKRDANKKGGDFYAFNESFNKKLHLKELRSPAIETLVRLVDAGVKVQYPEIYLLEDQKEILKFANENYINAVQELEEMIGKLSGSFELAKKKHDREANNTAIQSVINRVNKEQSDIQQQPKTTVDNQPVKPIEEQTKQKLSVEEVEANKEAKKVQMINKAVKALSPMLDAVEVGRNGYNPNKELTKLITLFSKANINITQKEVFEICKTIKTDGITSISKTIDSVCANNPNKQHIKKLTKKLFHDARYKNVEKYRLTRKKPR